MCLPDGIESVLEVQLLPIDSITPYDRNPRKNETAVRKVADSIEEFGWQQPIVVDVDHVIIAGHTRLAAAWLLGHTHVPVVIADSLTPEQVRAYRLADNRTAEESEWNTELLIQELQALSDAGVDLDATGFNSDELEKLLADAEANEIRPDIIFSEELMESNNYVVLVFRNDVDWLAAQTHFKLETRYSKRRNGKPWSSGIGRVIDGAAYLDSLNDD